MKVVNFREKDHKYTCDGEVYESCSGLWKPYMKQFKPYEVSIKKAFSELDTENYVNSKKKLSYSHEGLIKHMFEQTTLDHQVLEDLAQEFRDTWADKSQTGTDFHAKEEKQDLERGWKISPFTGKKCPVVKWEIEEGYDNQSCPYDIFNVPDGYIPELLAVDHESKTCGQADLAFFETIDGVRYVDLDDYKSDRVIELKPGFFNRAKVDGVTIGFQSLYPPFDHIYDTNFWKYTLKISTYARMLEKAGFVVRNLAITHVVVDENLNRVSEKRYILPYKGYEAELALQLRLDSI